MIPAKMDYMELIDKAIEALRLASIAEPDVVPPPTDTQIELAERELVPPLAISQHRVTTEDLLIANS
jgi:hypothetical protein